MNVERCVDGGVTAATFDRDTMIVSLTTDHGASLQLDLRAVLHTTESVNRVVKTTADLLIPTTMGTFRGITVTKRQTVDAKYGNTYIGTYKTVTEACVARLSWHSAIKTTSSTHTVSLNPPPPDVAAAAGDTAATTFSPVATPVATHTPQWNPPTRALCMADRVCVGLRVILDKRFSACIVHVDSHDKSHVMIRYMNSRIVWDEYVMISRLIPVPPTVVGETVFVVSGKYAARTGCVCRYDDHPQGGAMAFVKFDDQTRSLNMTYLGTMYEPNNDPALIVPDGRFVSPSGPLYVVSRTSTSGTLMSYTYEFESSFRRCGAARILDRVNVHTKGTSSRRYLRTCDLVISKPKPLVPTTISTVDTADVTLRRGTVGNHKRRRDDAENGENGDDGEDGNDGENGDDGEDAEDANDGDGGDDEDDDVEFVGTRTADERNAEGYRNAIELDGDDDA